MSLEIHVDAHIYDDRTMLYQTTHMCLCACVHSHCVGFVMLGRWLRAGSFLRMRGGDATTVVKERKAAARAGWLKVVYLWCHC